MIQFQQSSFDNGNLHYNTQNNKFYVSSTVINSINKPKININPLLEVCINPIYLVIYHIITWVFMRESSYCFQRILAIAILSVRPSVSHTR